MALCLAFIVLAAILVAGILSCRRAPRRDPYTPTPDQVEAHQTLHILAEAVDALARRHGIQYWPLGGTMLGAVRHGGFIPWDDDVDIGVWAGDLPRLRAAVRAELAGKALWWEGARCSKISPHHRNDTVIDVFPSVRDHLGRVVFENAQARAKWPLEYFTAEEFGAAARPLRFGPVVFRAPERPCSYLDRVYPGWDRRGVDMQNHSPSYLRRLVAQIAPDTYVLDAGASRARCGAG